MGPDAPEGRLVFVGLGLGDEDGLSIAGMKELEAADVVFAEAYTSTLRPGALQRLEARSGRKIELLDRAAVEGGARIMDESERKRVVLLVAGDPMAATTHVDLRLRAAKRSIRTAVVHGASALTAVPGLLGLQHYKFGRATTLPYPQEGFSPTSPYEIIAENLARGLHTLVLLDIDAENSRYMSANEGMHLLLDMERRTGKRVISGDTLVCVVARAGSLDAVVRAGRIDDLVSDDFGPPLHTIVVPGKLHFMEEESLAVFAKR
ncbi:MAG: diphthine synthase [Euryarchaeota archaeon RBG_16_62_10]|nr:MAG: diphthine synthase [Euryarchaeota archaeon RBG_16_62_10]